MEKFLNDLGRDEWEIVHFHTPPDNFLAFTGLARRSTQRDWTLQDAAAAAAKAEAEKLRAEFEAKFKAASTTVAASGGEERGPSFLEEKSAPDDGFRKPVDTSRDDDPESQEDEKADEWDKLTAAEEDELPTFFEAIRPHMRRNQRGPGMSVGVDYLAKKWDQSEDDVRGALVECGFVLPADEDSKAEYLEYDGDLFWLNINRRGELWINTKEKPRPVFRAVKAQRIAVEEEAPKPAPEAETPEAVERKPDDSSAPAEGAPEVQAQNGNRKQKSGGAPVPLPEGTALLQKIRPHMRRNRRGPGGSGSTTFLSRALRTNENELKTAFIALGLTIPTAPADKPVYTEFGDELWWLNLDSRGGLWINGREKKEGETAASANEAAEATPVDAAAGSAPATEGEPATGVAAATANGETPAMSDAASVPTTESAPSPSPAPASAPAAEPNAIPPLLSDFAPAPAPVTVTVTVAPPAEPAAEPVAEPVASSDPAAPTESAGEKEKPRRGRPRKKESEPEQAG